MAEILTISKKAEIGKQIDNIYKGLTRQFAAVNEAVYALQNIKQKMQADPNTFTPEDIEVVDALLWAIGRFVDLTKTPSSNIDQVIADYRAAQQQGV